MTGEIAGVVVVSDVTVGVCPVSTDSVVVMLSSYFGDTFSVVVICRISSVEVDPVGTSGERLEVDMSVLLM